MAYIEGYGPSGNDNGDDAFDARRDEPSLDFTRQTAVGVVSAAIVILVASVISSNKPDTSPWTSGSAAIGLSMLSIVLAAGLVYRAVRRTGGTAADGSVAILTVMLATPLAAAAGFVVLAILGVSE